MSRKTKSVMGQKLLFIKMWQSGDYTITSLCDRFNISRKIGHKLVKRFVREGETMNGAARWRPYNGVLISRAAIGRYIGTEEIGNGIWNVYYRDVLLGWMDEKAIGNKETYLHIQRIEV